MRFHRCLQCDVCCVLCCRETEAPTVCLEAALYLSYHRDVATETGSSHVTFASAGSALLVPARSKHTRTNFLCMSSCVGDVGLKWWSCSSARRTARVFDQMLLVALGLRKARREECHCREESDCRNQGRYRSCVRASTACGPSSSSSPRGPSVVPRRREHCRAVNSFFAKKRVMCTRS